MTLSNYPDNVDPNDPHIIGYPEEPEVVVIDEEAEAEAIRQLAIAQACYKCVKSEVATGDPYNLRGVVDAIMSRRFDEARKLGVKPRSFDIEVDGANVGTFSITASEAKPAEDRMELSVENRQELLAWAVEHGCVEPDMKMVDMHFKATGEVPDGCTAVPVHVPAKKGGISRTSLRIDPAKVASALGADELGYQVTKMLEGGK